MMEAPMQRRAFITLLGGAAATAPLSWPLSADAQQRPIPLIAHLNGGAPDSPLVMQNLAAFRQGLSEAGVVEGQTATLEARYASSQYELLPGILSELIARKPAVIAASGAVPAVAAKAATTTIPIVFNMGEDPVSLGLVASLNRPGGNITGIAFLNSAVVPKRLEMLSELVPKVKTFAALINPKSPNAEISTKDVLDAARTLGLQIHVLHASSAGEIDTAFERLVQLKAGALLLAPDGIFNANVAQIAVLAARHAIATSHEFRLFPVAGGLMSYGGSNIEGSRQAALYVARILKGEKPADLPIIQPTKFDLVINLKTARALGITVPPTLLVSATEVIE
jgi:putative tryptophan/tyrosine transport system substrate-binding protein